MPTSHDVLGLPPAASDEEIRSRYLDLVRQFPPESAPARFAEIRAAYDELSDPRKRFEHVLFKLSDESLNDVIAEVNLRQRDRIPVDDLLSLG
ncbi:DnaJ domain-containing protein [Pirellulales bacterium]|nr:DnaJ domain-containing protein [Pirellulales bacterium]